MNNEQMTQEQRAQLIEKLHTEYNDLNGKIARLNAFLCDIDFVKKVPDPMEQELMSMQFRSMKGYLDNLRARIMFQEIKQSQEEKNSQAIDDWVNMNRRVVNTLCGPVHLVNLDEQHHCGQDASCPVGGGSAAVITGDSLKDLLGMEVISVGDMPCDACNPDNYAGRPCVKVELVGGTYLCLAPQPGSIITE
ncbi:MAG: hypothetical protein SPL96_11080 [Bacteroidales bacterium]|nr:hypothetical protein [Bacteroidales bacterium]